jgi:hypothetical protein
MSERSTTEIAPEFSPNVNELIGEVYPHRDLASYFLLQDVNEQNDTEDPNYIDVVEPLLDNVELNEEELKKVVLPGWGNLELNTKRVENVTPKNYVSSLLLTLAMSELPVESIDSEGESGEDKLGDIISDVFPAYEVYRKEVASALELAMTDKEKFIKKYFTEDRSIKLYQKVFNSAAAGAFMLSMVLSGCIGVNGRVVSPSVEEPTPVVEVIESTPTATSSPVEESTKKSPIGYSPEKSLGGDDLELILPTEEPIVWPTSKPTDIPVEEPTVVEEEEFPIADPFYYFTRYYTGETDIFEEVRIFGYYFESGQFHGGDLKDPDPFKRLPGLTTLFLDFRYEGQEITTEGHFIIGTIEDNTTKNRGKLYPIKVKLMPWNSRYTVNWQGEGLKSKEIVDQLLKMDKLYVASFFVMNKEEEEPIWYADGSQRYSEEDWVEMRLIVDEIWKNGGSSEKYEFVLESLYNKSDLPSMKD